MSDLTTNYMGLQLHNPILVASCSLSKNIEGIKRIEGAGAGAVVLKSLFEEQLQVETKAMEGDMGPSWHTEAHDYVRNMGMQLGPNEYLKLIESAKKKVAIPIIASLNCISPRWWIEYAAKIESAGADALELNVSFLPTETQPGGKEIENIYYATIESIKTIVNLPVAIKIGPFFTSLAQVCHELYKRGAAALVLFNRFYQVDIDSDKLSYKSAVKFSSPEELSLPLRWIALLSGRIKCDFAATSGVHDAQGAIKMLLAGATVVQLCSTLYIHGLEKIGEIVKELGAWMKVRHFETIDQFRGKLSREQSEQPELLERLQYIKALVGIE